MPLTKEELTRIFSPKRVCDDEETLAHYSLDQSLCPKRRPDYVVFAETVEEIQALIPRAADTGTPIIPYSSGLNLNGAALPDHGGIILNLSRMDKILHIDKENWFAIIEPGVTYERLQKALNKEGFSLMVPFGVPPKRSVLTSYLERDPVLASPSFEHGNFLIMDTELILPGGELFKTGMWTAGGKPGGPMGPVRNLLFRLWTGAQGTLGIMTKMGIKINPVVEARKVFFITFDDLSQAIEPLKRIQRREIGMECFLLNSFNLACILSEEWEIPQTFPTSPSPSESVERLRSILPPYTMTICLRGAPRHPEEKIAYEEEALREIATELHLPLTEALPQAKGLGRIMSGELAFPFSILKKFNYRGSVQTITFKSPLSHIGEMEARIKETIGKDGYDPRSLGAYLLPLERGRAIHVEFDLHVSPTDSEERKKVKETFLKASEALIREGAYFDRPYGPWAEMVYRRAGTYTEKLKELKRELDPKGILNPGKLCF
jgi:FAD/FMN-containing dehydrogenase